MERVILLARRAAAMKNEPVEVHLKNIVNQFARSLSRKSRGELATKLVASGHLSQREVHDLTGVSHDTIRKAQKGEAEAKE